MYPLATSAPWWGAPLIAAIALLVGSGLTLLVGWLRGRSDREHAEKLRWDMLILETCADVERICDELATIGKVGYPKYIADSNERIDRRIELTDELNQAVAKFMFVASEDMRIAAGHLYESAVSSFTASGSNEASGMFVKARKHFEDTARKELRAN